MVSGRVVATTTDSLRAHHRIADVPEMSLALLVDGFEIADGGAALRAPVDDVVAAINQPVFVQAHENFGHGARQLRRKREFLARPVAAFAQTAASAA